MIVNVKYHHEADGFWAESDEVPGWVATGATFGEVRDLVRDGLPFYLELEPSDIEIVEMLLPSEDADVDVPVLSAMPGVAPASRPELTFSTSTAVDFDLEVSFSPVMPGARRVPTPA